MSRTDRMIGIALGLVIGVVAVVLFVFLGGASSLDAPSLDSPAGFEREATSPGGQGAASPQSGGGEGAR
jgi:hypothetical protein